MTRWKSLSGMVGMGAAPVIWFIGFLFLLSLIFNLAAETAHSLWGMI